MTKLCINCKHLRQRSRYSTCGRSDQYTGLPTEHLYVSIERSPAYPLIDNHCGPTGKFFELKDGYVECLVEGDPEPEIKPKPKLSLWKRIRIFLGEA